jgi:putative oxidoreductase
MSVRVLGWLRPSARPSDMGGWVLRGGVALFFVLAGLEKFPSTPGSMWVRVFDQIGFGQWFRYFTGWVEIGGAILYLFPMTCPIGALLLACTMVGAMTAHIVVRHSFGASLYPAALIIAIVAIAMRRPDVPLDLRPRSPRARRDGDRE